MALVRAISLKDWKRRTAMKSDEMGRRRRPRKRSRVEGRPRRRPPKRSSVEGPPRRRPPRRSVGAETPPRRKPWSRSARLGENIEVRAKAPYRAASMEIRPGLYVVGELQGEALDFGASLNLSKHLFNAAKSGVKALESKSDKSKKRKGRHARRLAYLQQREQAMAIREHRLREREATMKRFEEWLKRVLPSGAGESSRSPFRRRATPWMGDEDLAGIADISDDEPYNLARIMAQWHEDDE